MKPWFAIPTALLCVAAAAPDLTEFVDVTTRVHRDSENGFSLEYPYEWTLSAKPGTVFRVRGPFGLPGASVFVRERPEGLTLAQAAATASAAIPSEVSVDSSRDFAIGDLQANETVLRWRAPMGDRIPLRTHVVALFRGRELLLIEVLDLDLPGGLSTVGQRVLDSLKIEPPVTP